MKMSNIQENNIDSFYSRCVNSDSNAIPSTNQTFGMQVRRTPLIPPSEYTFNLESQINDAINRNYASLKGLNSHSNMNRFFKNKTTPGGGKTTLNSIQTDGNNESEPLLAANDPSSSEASSIQRNVTNQSGGQNTSKGDQSLWNSLMKAYTNGIASAEKK